MEKQPQVWGLRLLSFCCAEGPAAGLWKSKVFSLYSQHSAFTVQARFPWSPPELQLTSRRGQLQNVFGYTQLRCCCFSKQFISHECQICDVHCAAQVYRIPFSPRHKPQHFGNWISPHAMWLQIYPDSLFPFLLCPSKEGKMVRENYLCNIISIKIHFICKVLLCSGKSDTKGLMCNYVLCIYKHTHTHSAWWAVLIKKQKADVTFTQYNKHRSKNKLPQDH